MRKGKQNLPTETINKGWLPINSQSRKAQKGIKMDTRSTPTFTVDFIHNTIKGTKTAFNKASKGYGDAYDELMKHIQAHPNFKCMIYLSFKGSYSTVHQPLPKGISALSQNALSEPLKGIRS